MQWGKTEQNGVNIVAIRLEFEPWEACSYVGMYNVYRMVDVGIGGRNRARRPTCVRRHDSRQHLRLKPSGL